MTIAIKKPVLNNSFSCSFSKRSYSCLGLKLPFEIGLTYLNYSKYHLGWWPTSVSGVFVYVSAETVSVQAPIGSQIALMEPLHALNPPPWNSGCNDDYMLNSRDALCPMWLQNDWEHECLYFLLKKIVFFTIWQIGSFRKNYFHVILPHLSGLSFPSTSYHFGSNYYFWKYIYRDKNCIKRQTITL